MGICSEVAYDVLPAKDLLAEDPPIPVKPGVFAEVRKESSRMALTELSSQQEYEEYAKSKDLSVIHFHAPWADQCSQINGVLEEMSTLAEYKQVRFAKIEAEKVPEISLKAGISAVPTVILVKSENIVDRVDGANPSALTDKIKLHCASKESTTMGVSQGKEALDSRLKRLINQAPCMLFMKGNPTAPKCGFSREIISILNGYNAEYQTFDILQDNDVREGLKKFSNWPTYPQLYINGELIGGLDIVREMCESGDMDSMLPKKASVEDKS